MSFDPGASPLAHILEAIEAIRPVTTGMTLDLYSSDLKTRSTVERMFQILSEAAFRIGEHGKTICPEIDWRGLRGMGNFLRHDYERVEDGVIWDAIHQDLPPLEACARRALAGPGAGSAGTAQ